MKDEWFEQYYRLTDKGRKMKWKNRKKKRKETHEINQTLGKYQNS